MRRLIVSLAAAITLSVLAATPARAITNGTIDTDHPYVGSMGVEFEPGVAFFFCSGTLIAPDVFLTAAHCLAFLGSLESVVVTFDGDLNNGVTPFVRSRAAYFAPAFTSAQGDTHDLGVIILVRDVTEWNGIPIEPAELPSAGQLDQMAAHGGLRNQSFDVVGYGAAASFKGGPPRVHFAFIRKVATSAFQALTPPYLKLLINSDATGQGGVCYGDSGGPTLMLDTDIILGVQSEGDRICRAEAIAYRLDTPQAREFLGQFVTLP